MKILYLELDNCNDCPFCEHTEEIVDDSGYDCHHPDMKYVHRILDGDNFIFNMMPIWCPLNDKE